MRKYRGIPASPGIALGPAYRYETGELRVERQSSLDAGAELERFEDAREIASEQIVQIQAKAAAETSAEEAAIFEAHALFLQDPALLDAIRAQIESEGVNAEFAVEAAVEEQAGALEAMQDEYFSARAADVRDVGQRLIRVLLGVAEVDLSSLDQPSIVLAQDLTPSDTVRLDKSLVLGFCTAVGGPTSHTAILAKALDIPAIVGAGEDAVACDTHTPLAIDGTAGELVVEPDSATQKHYLERKETYEALASQALTQAHDPALTLDGHTVEIVANVGNPADTRIALERGAEGIGLLRTEFLYLERESAPDEGEQLAAYNEILDLMETRPVVVRTLDIGGDKDLPYLDLGHEANPFLGWRAIRMTLDRPKFFKTQLRALLRASPGHDLRIMFPMVATLQEVRDAKELLSEVRAALIEEGHSIAETIQVGIMVEIPSVAVLADRFAREVDFFSIGTNDLTQYTMAAERTNEKVAYLGDACHPAILRQIQRVIQAAHERGIWVGLCGELAGDPDAIPVLLGLGLDEFSMAPASIPRAKAIIRGWSRERAGELAESVLDLDSAQEVRARVRAAQRDAGDQA
jgi:phosphotransferase system enzyme I (PtsI)